MFGRRDLKKNGVKAQAVVRECDMTGSINSHGAHKWRLDLEVTYEDGTTGEASCDAWEFDIAAGFGRGESVPVLYDPKDRSRVEVDEDGMKAASEDRVSALQASAARLEAEMRARGDTPPAR
jgi:hypothetical protein